MQLVLNANTLWFCQIALLRVFAFIVLPCVLGGCFWPVAVNGVRTTYDEFGPGVILFQGLQSWRKPLRPIAETLFFSCFSALLFTLEMRDSHL